jgi:hypothetical protein
VVEPSRPAEDELWLFVDTVTGLPVKPEMHNNRWHRVREWVEQNDPDNAWPKTIVSRNLRHHAATKWFHDELGEPWGVVAQYLGYRLMSVLNDCARPGEDALRYGEATRWWRAAGTPEDIRGPNTVAAWPAGFWAFMARPQP